MIDVSKKVIAIGAAGVAVLTGVGVLTYKLVKTHKANKALEMEVKVVEMKVEAAKEHAMETIEKIAKHEDEIAITMEEQTEE